LLLRFGISPLEAILTPMRGRTSSNQIAEQ
jgi:hypothetical protein